MGFTNLVVAANGMDDPVLGKVGDDVLDFDVMMSGSVTSQVDVCWLDVKLNDGLRRVDTQVSYVSLSEDDNKMQRYLGF